MEFETAFNRIMNYEGDYVNDPDDPGGETKWGISKRSYPNLIIKDLTREDAQNIYRKDFWIPLNISKLSDTITFQLFDFAINSGIQTAIRYFQRALNVADDGYFGLESIKIMNETSETDMIMKLNAERLDYMTRLKNWDKNSKGWARRISNNLRYGALDS